MEDRDRDLEALRRELALEFRVRDRQWEDMMGDIQEIKDSNRWLLRAVVTQMLAIIGGLATVFFVKGL